jgi:hypothetical protein
LGEYKDVLARPELRIRPARARAVIAHIELTERQIDVIALSSDGFQDPDDLLFAEVFLTSNAQALVWSYPLPTTGWTARSSSHAGS